MMVERFSIVLRVDSAGRCAKCGCAPGDHHEDPDPEKQGWGIWTRCRNHPTRDDGRPLYCFIGE